MGITLRNAGLEALRNVRATITTTTPGITIVDGTEQFGNIAGGQMATCTEDFDFTVGAGVADEFGQGDRAPEAVEDARTAGQQGLAAGPGFPGRPVDLAARGLPARRRGSVPRRGGAKPPRHGSFRAGFLSRFFLVFRSAVVQGGRSYRAIRFRPPARSQPLGQMCCESTEHFAVAAGAAQDIYPSSVDSGLKKR